MKIKVSEVFTKRPGHRSPADGPFSGEVFLAEVLEPAYLEAISQHEELVVDLDGTAGYATSFLEASFGGLARKYPVEEVQKRIKIVCISEPYLNEEVHEYIQDARNKKANERKSA